MESFEARVEEGIRGLDSIGVDLERMRHRLNVAEERLNRPANSQSWFAMVRTALGGRA